MAKRRAGSQLTKENCEDDDDSEELGEFQKAESDLLSQRVMKKAKRRSSGSVASPLSNFTGFASSSNNSPFSFLTKPATSEPKPVGQTTKAECLKTLNLCFIKWIQQHLDKNPYVVLLPIFKDYEKHYCKLKDESPSADKPALNILPTQTSLPSTSQPPAFNFFQTPSSTAAPRIGAGLFNFGKNDSKSETTGDTSLPKPSFSFGLNKVEPPKTSGFQFTNSSVSSVLSKVEEEKKSNDNGETNNDEPSDEPPNFDFVAPSEEGSTFEMRCKVFFKKDGSYASIGVGTLYLKPVAGGKTQLITRADTSQGSVLLNLILTPDLPLQKTGKNNVLLVCVPTPETEPPPVPVLVRVKSEEDRDRLLSEMERLRGS